MPNTPRETNLTAKELLLSILEQYTERLLSLPIGQMYQFDKLAWINETVSALELVDNVTEAALTPAGVPESIARDVVEDMRGAAIEIEGLLNSITDRLNFIDDGLATGFHNEFNEPIRSSNLAETGLLIDPEPEDEYDPETGEFLSDSINELSESINEEYEGYRLVGVDLSGAISEVGSISSRPILRSVYDDEEVDSDWRGTVNQALESMTTTEPDAVVSEEVFATDNNSEETVSFSSENLSNDIVKNPDIFEEWTTLNDRGRTMYIFARYSHLDYHYTVNDIRYKLYADGPTVVGRRV